MYSLRTQCSFKRPLPSTEHYPSAPAAAVRLIRNTSAARDDEAGRTAEAATSFADSKTAHTQKISDDMDVHHQASCYNAPRLGSDDATSVTLADAKAISAAAAEVGMERPNDLDGLITGDQIEAKADVAEVLDTLTHYQRELKILRVRSREMEATAAAELLFCRSMALAGEAAADERQRLAELVLRERETELRELKDRISTSRHLVVERLCRMRGRERLLGSVMQGWHRVSQQSASERRLRSLEEECQERVQCVEARGAAAIASVRAEMSSQVTEAMERATEAEEHRAELAHRMAMAEVSLQTSRSEASAVEAAAQEKTVASSGQLQLALATLCTRDAELATTRNRLAEVIEHVVSKLHKINGRTRKLSSAMHTWQLVCAQAHAEKVFHHLKEKHASALTKLQSVAKEVEFRTRNEAAMACAASVASVQRAAAAEKASSAAELLSVTTSLRERDRELHRLSGQLAASKERASTARRIAAQKVVRVLSREPSIRTIFQTWCWTHRVLDMIHSQSILEAKHAADVRRLSASGRALSAADRLEDTVKAAVAIVQAESLQKVASEQEKLRLADEKLNESKALLERRAGHIRSLQLRAAGLLIDSRSARGTARLLVRAVYAWRVCVLRMQLAESASRCHHSAALSSRENEVKELHGVCSELAHRVRTLEHQLECAHNEVEVARAETEGAKAEMLQIQTSAWPATLRTPTNSGFPNPSRHHRSASTGRGATRELAKTRPAATSKAATCPRQSDRQSVTLAKDASAVARTNPDRAASASSSGSKGFPDRSEAHALLHGNGADVGRLERSESLDARLGETNRIQETSAEMALSNPQVRSSHCSHSVASGRSSSRPERVNHGARGSESAGKPRQPVGNAFDRLVLDAQRKAERSWGEWAATHHKNSSNNRRKSLINDRNVHLVGDSDAAQPAAASSVASSRRSSIPGRITPPRQEIDPAPILDQLRSPWVAQSAHERLEATIRDYTTRSIEQIVIEHEKKRLSATPVSERAKPLNGQTEIWPPGSGRVTPLRSRVVTPNASRPGSPTESRAVTPTRSRPVTPTQSRPITPTRD